jgi:ABC-type Na+ efflux pump permease subunit
VELVVEHRNLTEQALGSMTQVKVVAEVSQEQPEMPECIIKEPTMVPVVIIMVVVVALVVLAVQMVVLAKTPLRLV